MWSLVQFVEDKIWFVTNKINHSPQNTMCQWRDRRWYSAVVYQTSNDKDLLMQEALQKNSDSEQAQKLSSDLHKHEITNKTKSWRRMCNVGLDTDNINNKEDKTNKVNKTVTVENTILQPGLHSDMDTESATTEEEFEDKTNTANKTVTVENTILQPGLHSDMDTESATKEEESEDKTNKANKTVTVENTILQPGLHSDMDTESATKEEESDCENSEIMNEPFEEMSPEYIPSDMSDSNSSIDESPECLHNDLKDGNGNSLLENSKTNLLPTTKPEYLTESVQEQSIPLSPEGENILDGMIPLPVASVSRNANNKFLWNKKFLCVFCRKLYAKLPRHFYKDHADEFEIAKIQALDKKSKERQHLLDKLRNQGVYIRNKNAIKEGAGNLEPKRRPTPNSKKDIRDYLPCTHCFQMFATKYLSRHVRNCPYKPKASTDVQKRNRCLKSESYLLLPVGPNVSSRFREHILSKMNNDDIFRIIRNDQLILLFGESEFKRLGHDRRYHRTITDRCRELGRLVIKAKQIEPNISKLVQLIDPARYKTFRDAAMQAAGYDENAGIYKAPSLVLKIGYTIKKCISVLKGEYLEDDVLRTEVAKLDTFLEILNSKWGNEVTLHAHRNLNELKWNAPKRIPVTRDIQLTHKYLLQQCETYSTLLIQNPEDKYAFQKLVEATLVMVIVLNRRRVGEVQYMQLSDYLKARSADKDSDIFSTLNESEKILSQSLVRLVIKGKRGRGVPVLLTKQMQKNLELLNSRRLRCGIDPLNKFLFPSLRNAAGHYRAYTLLNNIAKRAGCQYPGRILSTQLRKHVATTVQLLNLKENELDSLAQFMGHDIRVHREYYRLSDETVQLAKISKILVNMEKGNIENMRGKSLEDITVENEILDFDVEDENELIDENDAATKHQSDMPQEQQQQGEYRSSRLHIERATSGTKNKKKQKATNTKPKKPWTSEEIRLTMEYFQNYVAMKRVPGKVDIEIFLKNNPQIKRTWTNIKDFLYNKIR